MPCLQAAKHNTSSPVWGWEPAWLPGYFQGLLESHCWAALRGHQCPQGPCRESKLETPLRRHKQLLRHRKLHSSTKGQNSCVTSVAHLSVGVSWVVPPPPSGVLLLRALSVHQRALSNVQRGQKLYEPAGHRERTIHFSLEVGY